MAFNNAVTIEPLSWKEIESSVSKAGESLQGVHVALQNDANLQEMASTPLMLNIIVTTFQNTPIDTILLTKDSEKRRKLIFEKYTERVLTRRGAKSQYSLEQTKRWLAWLAEHLKQHNQTVFYLERIQPDTLPHNQEHFHQIIVQAICCIETFILAATLAWLRGGRTFGRVGGGLLAELGSGPWERVLGWMSTGLGLRGLGGGGLVSLVFAIVSVLVGIMVDSAPTGVSKGWTRIQQGILIGIRTGCICGVLVGSFCLLLFGVRSGFSSGLSYGSSFGLLTSLIVGIWSGLTTSLREEKPARRKFLQGVLPGFFGLIGFWGIDKVLHIVDDFAYGFVVAIFFYTAYSFGKANEHLRIPEEIQPSEIVMWSWSNARRSASRNLTRGSLIGIVTSLSITLCLGSVSGIARGPAYGIALGSVFGPIVGVSVGIAAILSGLLNSGLTSDMLPKQDRVHPNEGIH